MKPRARNGSWVETIAALRKMAGVITFRRVREELCHDPVRCRNVIRYACEIGVLSRLSWGKYQSAMAAQPAVAEAG